MSRLIRLLLIISVGGTIAAFAGDIREFDIKTIERLGNELTQVSQRADRGATTAVRKRARDTAIAASKGKLFKAHYDYVVLNDPDGSGFLVYALAESGRRTEALLGGNLRVTVSADGAKAERVDDLSKGIMKSNAGPGARAQWMVTVDPVSDIPDETYICSSKRYGTPIFVVARDSSYWQVADGKIWRINKEEIDGAQKKGKKSFK